MAGSNDFTGQNIQDTYQRVLQLSSSGQLADGTGSLVPLLDVTASFAVSASHEITKEVTSSYAETASAAEHDFNIANDLNFDNTSAQITANGSSMFLMQPSNEQTIFGFDLRSSDGRGIKFGVNSDYTIKHNSTATNDTKLAIVEGSSIRYTFGIGGHLTASANVNIKTGNGGEFRGQGANITAITSSTVSASTHIQTSTLKGGGDDVSLNVLGSITASNAISASGNVLGRDGIFTRDNTAKMEIIGLASIGGIVGTDTNHDLVFRRNNVEGFRLNSNGISAGTNISASGNISASNLIAQNHITASGNISSSGTITAASYVGLPSGILSSSGLSSGIVSGSGQINALINDTIAATIVAEIDNDEIPIAKLSQDSITIAGNTTALGGSITGDTIAQDISNDTISGNQIDGGTIGTITIQNLASGVNINGSISSSGDMILNDNSRLLVNTASITQAGMANNIATGVHTAFFGSGSSNTSVMVYSDTGHGILQLRSNTNSNAQILFNEDGNARYILGHKGVDDAFYLRNDASMTGGDQLFKFNFDGSGVILGNTGSDGLAGAFHTTASANLKIFGNTEALGSITASNNISASGTGSFSDGRFTGKVGIGTLTPAAKLHVEGDISSSGTSALTIGNIKAGSLYSITDNATGISLGTNEIKFQDTDENDIIEITNNITHFYLAITASNTITALGNISGSSLISQTHVTASGNISASGNVEASGYKGVPVVLVNNSEYLGSATSGQRWYYGNNTQGWYHTMNNFISVAPETGVDTSLSQGGQHNSFIVPFDVKDVELRASVRMNKDNSQGAFWLAKKVRQDGGSAYDDNLVFMASASTIDNTDTGASKFYNCDITGSHPHVSTAVASAGEEIYVFWNPFKINNNTDGSQTTAQKWTWTLSAKTA